MSGEIRVPRLGWSMDEGTFVEWLKKDGDVLVAGEPLFVLESEKSAQEIEALDAGRLRLLPDGPRPGEIVKVGQLIGHVDASGEGESFHAASSVSSTLPSRGGGPGSGVAAAPDDGEAKGDSQAATSATPHLNPPPQGGRGEERAFASTSPAPSSPRARRVARELGIDWTTVSGTGRGGRVRERDIRAAVVSTSHPGDTVVPHSPTRRTIAERMVASLRASAPVTLTTRAVATNLVALRNQFKATARSVDEPLPGVTDLVIKLVARVLIDHPWLNARREGDRTVLLADAHIGLAVDTEAGLFVPVIRNVARLSVRQVSAQSRALIKKARERALTPDDQRGGTFTVTNLGMYGVDAFTPIINPPETAILGLGTLRREPVCGEGDRITACDTITLSLTFDHQVVDGGPAARFLRDLSRGLENIAALLVD